MRARGTVPPHAHGHGRPGTCRDGPSAENQMVPAAGEVFHRPQGGKGKGPRGVRHQIPVVRRPVVAMMGKSGSCHLRDGGMTAASKDQRGERVQ